jgi:hypothetical protein
MPNDDPTQSSESVPLTTEGFLWTFAYELGDAISAQGAYLDSQYDLLVQQASRKLNLHQQDELGRQQQEYTHGCVTLQAIKNKEEETLRLIELLTNGEITEEDAKGFLPEEFLKKKQEEREAQQKTKYTKNDSNLALSGPNFTSPTSLWYYGILGTSFEPAEQGRLTTGRHLSRR